MCRQDDSTTTLCNCIRYDTIYARLNGSSNVHNETESFTITPNILEYIRKVDASSINNPQMILLDRPNRENFGGVYTRADDF